MMLYDLYCELHEKKLQRLKAEMEAAANPAVSDTGVEAATTEENPPAEGFQPMNVNDLPNVEK